MLSVGGRREDETRVGALDALEALMQDLVGRQEFTLRLIEVRLHAPGVDGEGVFSDQPSRIVRSRGPQGERAELQDPELERGLGRDVQQVRNDVVTRQAPKEFVRSGQEAALRSQRLPIFQAS